MKNVDDRGPQNPTHQEIEELAFQLWIMRGRPFGAPITIGTKQSGR